MSIFSRGFFYKSLRRHVILYNKNLYDHEKIDEPALPSLVQIQRKSFEKFVNEGIKEEFAAISPVSAYGGKYELEFLDNYHLDAPEFSFQECQARELTYASPLRVPVRLVNKETGEILEQEVFMSDLPVMSEQGTFLVNGTERVVVSQFVRSPGVYFREKPLLGLTRKSYRCTIIPSRGGWLEIESDSNGLLYANINKLKKVPVTTFLGALGYTEKQIIKSASGHALIKIFWILAVALHANGLP